MSTFADSTFTPPELIRNFCIIAHIDHGKSTLADRMLQLTGVVERPRPCGPSTWTGWTSSASAASPSRRRTCGCRGRSVPTAADHVLHMIDTPGHVDFTYEVSPVAGGVRGRGPAGRRRAGHRGADPGQPLPGAGERPHVIPVLNKIDLPAAEPDKYAAELAHIIGCEPDDVLRVSAKTGLGVERAARRDRRARCRPRSATPTRRARAMIFDSVYDTYRGVVTYIRVVDGKITPRERIKMMSTGATHELLEVGVISPEPKPSAGPGRRRGRLPDHRREGRPPVQGRRHRDRRAARRPPSRSAGYREPKPMVYSGPVPDRRLRLPGAARGPGQAPAQRRRPDLRARDLGRAGLRLPLRLPRPAAPGDHPRPAGAGVRPRPDLHRAERRLPRHARRRHRDRRDQPVGLARRQDRRGATSRSSSARSSRRSDFIGAIMELCQSRRGQLGGMDYLSEDRVELRYTHAAGRDHLRLLRRPEVRAPAATPRWTTRRPASRPPTWSRSTSCCRASRSTPSPPSCTRTTPTPTAPR